MKNLIIVILLLMATTGSAQTNFFDFTFNDIEGNPKSLNEFKGKKILIVNPASECGFTSQYNELQEMHEKFGDKLIVIGFPANNFGGQEPAENNEISTFCTKNFGVTFLMAEKVEVVGTDIHPLFDWLCKQETASFSGDINWNFEKFLLNENGKLIARFRSATEPNAKEITDLIGG